LDAIGRRIAAYIGGTAVLPKLEQAWADAAYWFHDGLGEPLDTIAAAKLETAIEVLTGGEHMSGSERRLLRAIKAFHGVGPDQLLSSQSDLTVKQFVKRFVEHRSRILHGNWSTLNTHLGDNRPYLTLLAQSLLTHYAVELDAYATAPRALDKMDEFLAAVERRRAVKLGAKS
jgi:hypothetical protein